MVSTANLQIPQQLIRIEEMRQLGIEGIRQRDRNMFLHMTVGLFLP